ncbi:MAG: hypothetical protein AAFY56_00130 [Pseudomonadota bacterium]
MHQHLRAPPAQVRSRSFGRGRHPDVGGDRIGSGHADTVLARLQEGRSIDELVETIALGEYRDWGAYDDWRALNIQGMARHLQETNEVN